MRTGWASLVLWLAASAAAGQTRAPAEGLRATLDTLVPALLREQRIPGAAIAVIRNGGVEWTAGYGRADVASGAPVRDDTRFNIGSTSKTLTAWAVMALAAQGRVDLDQPVDRYLTRWHLPAGE